MHAKNECRSYANPVLFYIKGLDHLDFGIPREGGVPERPSGYGGMTVSRTLGCTQQWPITNLPQTFIFKIKIILTIQISVCVYVCIYLFLKPYREYFLLQYKNSFLNTLTPASTNYSGMYILSDLLLYFTFINMYPQKYILLLYVQWFSCNYPGNHIHTHLKSQ